ncbi:AAA family ATPase [Phytoactinopolyspora halotolerans]|uniref:AAA family ATPase n=2 Tax=Phytoactinopolyspora halotolerans TaxID=1981512 RepID=A0A6L9SCP8_9ACTN|nr:AAA family ATPase [Phytoactinopolyspora halotolerans]
MLYERLDRLRQRTSERLAELYKQPGFNHQAVWEREAFVDREVERMERLLGVDRGLCFGRLDTVDGDVAHIGRMAIADDDYNPLLIDWRAPAAEPFYRATAANPGNLARRRHIQVRHRKVTGIDDEVFTGDDATLGAVHGEAALLSALTAHRTGRMSDIVATIQAEQDRIIRAPMAGVLVVQGAPGTGKTVAALHRAAYLLYTHRERLERSGVLVIGPNDTFMRYIDQVLPSLGETGVTMTTVAGLVTGAEVSVRDLDDLAVLKGDVRMAGVVSAALRQHQRLPRRPVPVQVDGIGFELSTEQIRAARTRARRSRRPHNAARAVFARDLLTGLARDYLERSGQVADEEDIAETRAELMDDAGVRAVLDDLWPQLTPEQLVAAVFANPKVHRAATRALEPAERERLADPSRLPKGPWSAADIPLLDEAMELLGEIPDEEALAAARREEREREAEERFARELLSELDLGFPVDAGQVADRYRGAPARATVRERAGADRAWAYGHVIVDEAQELSPMAWRMVLRRVPSKSMTVVGDIAQTSAAGGARSWDAVLEPHVDGRWRLETLTVNYRTPAEIMAIAAGVLSTIDPSLQPPESVRSSGEQPWSRRVDGGQLAAETARAVRAELSRDAEGRLAVIAPDERAAEIARELRTHLSDDGARGSVAFGGDGAAALDARIAVLTVDQVKGLEFDAVIVVEPAGIVAASARGATDLYVAVTRPTQRLGVVHTGELPIELGALAETHAP